MKRKLTNDFMIDGSPMLEPDAGISIKFTDIAEEAVDASGYTHISVLRKDIKTWSFTYALLTAEEYNYIQSILKKKHSFSFTFKDEEGQVHTVKAYSKNKSVCYWSARRGLYKDLQFDIIEC